MFQDKETSQIDKLIGQHPLAREILHIAPQILDSYRYPHFTVTQGSPFRKGKISCKVGICWYRNR